MAQKKANYLTLKEQLERNRLDDDLFLILQDHLNGVDRGILRARLEALCNDEYWGGKDAITLYKEAHISTINIQKLLNMLCVEKKINQSLSLFDWIQYLSQQNYGHRHLEDFYHLLQSVKPRKSAIMPLFMMTLLTALGGIYLYFSPKKSHAVEEFISKITPIITHFLQTTFSVLKNIPLLLFIYNVLCIPSQAYQTIVRDKFRSFSNRLQKWFVGTMPATLCILAYALAYAAQGTFTPLALGLFITSSFISVIHSLMNFWHLKSLKDEPPKNSTLPVRMDYIRQQERRARTVQTIGVNLVASILVSVCVIFWGILPPSLYMMLGCITFINLVNFTRDAMLQRIHTKGAEQLQKNLYTLSRQQPQDLEDDTSLYTNILLKLDAYRDETQQTHRTFQQAFEREKQRIDRLQTITNRLIPSRSDQEENSEPESILSADHFF